MSTIRISLANISVAASPKQSIDNVVTAIQAAGDRDAQVVCFPECYLPGYDFALTKTPSYDAALLDEGLRQARDAARSAGVSVILGTERRVDSKRYLTAGVIDQDGVLLGWQDKVQLDPSEDPIFAAAGERRTFVIGALTFGVVICHEGWRYPEATRWAAGRGAQVVFHPHFHPSEEALPNDLRFADPRNSFHESVIRCRAAENTCYFASVNCAVAGSGTTSAIADPEGRVIAYQPRGEAGLLVADLDLSRATGFLAKRLRS